MLQDRYLAGHDKTVTAQEAHRKESVEVYTEGYSRTVEELFLGSLGKRKREVESWVLRK